MVGSIAAQGQTHDLLLQGGYVIDPMNNVDALRDVAIREDRIAVVKTDIPAGQAA